MFRKQQPTIRFVSVLWFFFAFGLYVPGQVNPLSFDRITMREGLSQSAVTAIFQDKKGFIWIGTRDGLNRFDGYKFRQFAYASTDVESISSNEILSINEDTAGMLWIGTAGNGLNFFDPVSERFFRYTGSRKSETALSSVSIQCIYHDPDGTMWVGTRMGVFRASLMPAETDYFSRLTLGKPHNPTDNPNLVVRSIQKSLSGKYLLLATESGFYFYNTASQIFKRLSINSYEEVYYTSFYQQSSHIMWLGSFEHGLIKVEFANGEASGVTKTTNFDNTQPPALYIRNNSVEAMYPDKYNNLWVATRDGLVRFDLKTLQKTIYTNNPLDDKSLGDNRLNTVYVDNTGLVWIGTEYQGISKIDLNRKAFVHLKSIPGVQNSLPKNNITAITGNQQGSVYIGTDGGGISQLQIDKYWNARYLTINSKTSPGIQNDYIIALLNDAKGNLWMGSNLNMIGQFSAATGACSYFPNLGHIFSFCESRGDIVWIGTWNRGLYAFNRSTHASVNYMHRDNDPGSISNDVVLCIFQDKASNIWVGTKGGGINFIGVNELNGSGLHFIKYRHELHSTSCLSNDDVNCIYQDKKGTLWIGTADGLNMAVFDKNGGLGFTSFFESDNLPNSHIHGILEDNSGNLWLSTNNGLSRFNPQTRVFTNYDVNDGLQADEFRNNAYFKDALGRMYFGGINGVSAFFPDSINQNQYLPKAAITDVKIIGQSASVNEKINGRVLLKQSIAHTNEIVLSYKDKEITLEFAALHFAVPTKNKYAYRLVGFNNKWQIVSSFNRTATYTNLDQGTYTFQVKASNNDAIWNNIPAELKITVLPPPWKTNWAILLYFLILIGILFLFRKYSLIAVKEKNKLVIEHLEREKIEELSKLKLQFFTNVSHELRTPLTLISNPVNDLITYENTDAYAQKQLSVIQKNVSRLLQLVNQLLDFRKIDSGQLKLSVCQTNIIDIVKDVAEAFKQHALSRKIDFELETDADEILLWIDKERIKTVFYNLISNAFKYSLNNTSITIEISGQLHSSHKESKTSLFAGKNHKKYNYTRVRIIDTGLGIDKSQLKRIFERFYQAANIDTSFYGGSGIGLAISREYIEMHGGKIEVESSGQEGSCFTVLLPTGKDHFSTANVTFESGKELQHIPAPNIHQSHEPIDVAAALPMEHTYTSEKDKPLLLLIEDSNELVEYLCDKLSDTYSISTAPNGLKGMETARDLNPDIIVTDLMMPEMDGLQMCRFLKEEIQTSHIPIIILTAKVSEESNIEGLETGADVFMMKPFNIHVLKAQLKTLLESRQRLRNNYNRELLLKPKDVTVTSVDERFLKKILEVVEDNIADPDFGIKEITNKMNMSHSVIFRKIKSLTGLNVVEFIRSFRLKKAALILEKNKITISEVSYMVGFSDPKYFSKCFQKEFMKTPSEYAHDAQALKNSGT